MRWVLFMPVAVLCWTACAMGAETIDVLGEDTAPYEPYAPYEADNQPVRIRIQPGLHGSTVPASLDFVVYFANLDFEPEEAASLPIEYAFGKRRPNAGHLHYYATYLGDDSVVQTDPNFWPHTNVFGGADSGSLVAPGIVGMHIDFPVGGPWLLYVESQYDDHTSRIRPTPQYIGQWDAALVTVENPVPEPATVVMAAICMAPAVIRRSRPREA